MKWEKLSEMQLFLPTPVSYTHLFEFTKQPSDLSDIAKGATAYVKLEINKPAEEVKLFKVIGNVIQEKYSMKAAPADTELSIPVSNTEEFEGSYTGTYVIRAYIGDGFYQSREFTITWVEKQPAVEHTVTAVSYTHLPTAELLSETARNISE